MQSSVDRRPPPHEHHVSKRRLMLQAEAIKPSKFTDRSTAIMKRNTMFEDEMKASDIYAGAFSLL